MTVDDMRALLDGLPGNMQMITPLGDGSFVSVCNVTTRVLPVTYPHSKTENMVVVYPCFCDREDDHDGIDLTINLN